MAAGDKVGEHGRPMVEDSKAGGQQNEEKLCAPNVSSSEFTMQNVLMKEDERVKSALFKLGQELRRSELDSGNTRDAFWRIIEVRLNDQSVLVRFSFVGHIGGWTPQCPRCVTEALRRLNYILEMCVRILRKHWTSRIALDKMARTGSSIFYRKWADAVCIFKASFDRVRSISAGNAVRRPVFCRDVFESHLAGRL